MKKVTYTMLFLLGLVFQSNVAVASASSSKADNGVTMSSSMGMTSSESEMDVDSAANPCHEMAQDNRDCCDFDCLISGHCINYCASFSHATFDVQSTDLDFFHVKGLPIEVRSIAYVYWQASFIYHPPKFIHTV